MEDFKAFLKKVFNLDLVVRLIETALVTLVALLVKRMMSQPAKA